MTAVTTDIPSHWGAAHPHTRHLAMLPPPRAGRSGPRSAVYRRRRILASVVVVVLFLAGWAALELLAGALGVAGTPPRSDTPPVASTVEIRPGDTFWSIASRLQPEGDPRPLVDRLVAAHGGTVLRAGEQLSVAHS